MIQPNVRASFGRREAEVLLALAGPAGETRLRNEGIDALLDDVGVVRAFLGHGEISRVPAPLAFYLLVRHALLTREVADRQLADYTAAVLLEFGALRPSHFPGAEADVLGMGAAPGGTFYLVDVLAELDRARGEREFLLRLHLGNVALWLAGVFPDHITHRVQRRGAPPLAYYDQMGASGFRAAASMHMALQHGLGDLFLLIADRFSDVRSALNGLSDTLFFPQPQDAVERLLREVADGFNRAE